MVKLEVFEHATEEDQKFGGFAHATEDAEAREMFCEPEGDEYTTFTNISYIFSHILLQLLGTFFLHFVVMFCCCQAVWESESRKSEAHRQNALRTSSRISSTVVVVEVVGWTNLGRTLQNQPVHTKFSLQNRGDVVFFCGCLVGAVFVLVLHRPEVRHRQATTGTTRIFLTKTTIFCWRVIRRIFLKKQLCCF